MAKHRKPDPQQHTLFANDSDQIKAHHLKRLRELRDELKHLSQERAERRRKAEDWEDIKRACSAAKP